MCRGLIVNAEGKVIAQPLPKFFNYEEFKGELPSMPYRVAEKLDGSLGICYPHKGVLSIATRGSFTSEQAKVGDEMLQQYIKDNGLDWYDEQYTYLFEIIYPQNRIVVNYGDAKRLVLLAVVNTNTGMERNPHETGYKDVAKELPPSTPIEDLRLVEAPNEEGFVLHWGNGLRLKIKFAEYVRLHRLLTQVSSKSIWELLANGQDIAEVLDNVPDEFYDWVRSVENKLKQGHSGIVVNSTQAYEVVKDMPTRKEVAAKLIEYEPVVRAVVFAMLDGKEYDHIIWKSLKPKYEQPFKTEVE